MTDVPRFPKPKDQPKPPPVVKRTLRDGREVINQLGKLGRDEYVRRKKLMWERQGRMCCLFGFIPDCPGRLNWAEAVFAHEIPKGHGGGSTDDRIEIDGRRQNGVAHPQCNIRQGSRHIYFNEVFNNARSTWEMVEGRTTPSGKVLYRCKVCGWETPAPTKFHKCREEKT